MNVCLQLESPMCATSLSQAQALQSASKPEPVTNAPHPGIVMTAVVLQMEALIKQQCHTHCWSSTGVAHWLLRAQKGSQMTRDMVRPVPYLLAGQ